MPTFPPVLQSEFLKCLDLFADVELLWALLFELKRRFVGALKPVE